MSILSLYFDIKTLHVDVINIICLYGKKVYQSIVKEGDKEFLIRVVVGLETDPKTVVTIYKTTKIKKYWELK